MVIRAAIRITVRLNFAILIKIKNCCKYNTKMILLYAEFVFIFAAIKIP